MAPNCIETNRNDLHPKAHCCDGLKQMLHAFWPLYPLLSSFFLLHSCYILNHKNGSPKRFIAGGSVFNTMHVCTSGGVERKWISEGHSHPPIVENQYL